MTEMSDGQSEPMPPSFRPVNYYLVSPGPVGPLWLNEGLISQAKQQLVVLLSRAKSPYSTKL